MRLVSTIEAGTHPVGQLGGVVAEKPGTEGGCLPADFRFDAVGLRPLGCRAQCQSRAEEDQAGGDGACLMPDPVIAR